jgi:opacity protein-like surface antigen
MKRAALLLAAVLLCLAPAAALAQMPPNAVTLKAGAYFPQADDLDDFDTGFNMEISFTRYFHPNFALELGVGYLKSEDGAELTSYPFTLNLKGVYPFMGAELYGLAGIGAYYVTAEGGGLDENDTVLGFQLGIGANFDLTPAIFIGAEGKYFWAKPDFGSPAGEVKIDGFQATANLGYRF